MVTVQVSDNESIDKSLKRFKKKLEKPGILKEYRNRKFFQKRYNYSCKGTAWKNISEENRKK